MGELIVSLIVASIIGHQIDEAKVKKYEMVKHNGEVVKVQFSKKSDYSCPMSCSLEHFHYAKESDHNIEHVWSIESISNDRNKKNYRFSVNGSDIVSYQIINVKQKPKRLPSIPIANQELAVTGE
jgi:plastocyanin domain-containing protein